jgi:type I restriction enzyme S subunit
MRDWIETKLHDKIHVKHGFPFKGEYFSSQGDYIILTPGNFYEEGGFKQQKGKEKFYTADFPESYLLNKGDLIVAMTEQAEGLLGSTAIVPSDNLYLHNQRIGLITIDEKIIDKMFLYHLFKTDYIRQQIKGSSSGTKVKHTSPEKIYDIQVYLPSVEEQKKIAAVLSALDAKIEVNNRINAELESLAKTIYDYWFVQFDFPNEDGKSYKASGGKMVYHPELKRKIPAGWEVATLGDLAEFNYGKGLKNDIRTGIGYPVIGSNGVIGYHSDFLVDGPGLVVGRKGTIGAVTFLHENFYPIDTTYYIKSKKDIKLYFLYFLLKTLGLEKMNSDSAVPGLSREVALNIFICLPPLKLIKDFESFVISSFYKKKNIQKENQQLTQLRDWLLPLLMNGQITIK